jgi:hypothetical protein
VITDVQDPISLWDLIFGQAILILHV